MALNTLLREAVFFPPPELINPEGLLRLRQAGAEEAVLGAIGKIPPWGRGAALGWSLGTPEARGRFGAWFARPGHPMYESPHTFHSSGGPEEGIKVPLGAPAMPLSEEGRLQEVTLSCPFPPEWPYSNASPTPFQEREGNGAAFDYMQCCYSAGMHQSVCSRD